MKTMTKSLMIGIAILGIAGSLSAATISYTTTTPISGAGTANGSFFLPKFDDNGGTLTLESVELYVTAKSWGGWYEIDNEGDASGSATLGVGTTITVSGPYVLIVTNQPSFSATDNSISADTDIAVDFAGTDWFRVVGPDESSANEESDSHSTTQNLANYYGPGDLTFNYNTNNITSATTDGIGPFDTNSSPANWEFEATVIYTYTPEPGTMALLATGGVLFLVRRRRSR